MRKQYFIIKFVQVDNDITDNVTEAESNTSSQDILNKEQKMTNDIVSTGFQKDGGQEKIYSANADEGSPNVKIVQENGFFNLDENCFLGDNLSLLEVRQAVNLYKVERKGKTKRPNDEVQQETVTCRKEEVSSNLEVTSTRNVCMLCNAKFTETHDLQKHLIHRHYTVHSTGKPYSCNICRKRYNKMWSLDIHMRIHSGDKPYTCKVCKKTFSQKYCLKTHLIIHSGKKPYSCNMCNKAFTQKGTLQYHMQTHSGEKPNVCYICNKGFIQKASLRRHMLTHTSEV